MERQLYNRPPPYAIIQHGDRFIGDTLIEVIRKYFGGQATIDCIKFLRMYPDSDNKKLILGILEDDLKRQSGDSNER